MARRLSALIALPVLLAAACGGDGTSQESFPLCADETGPATLRRMTRFEYGRTISDLTGVAMSVADQLPPDEETLGFDDIADAYSVSSLHVAAYLDAAERGATTLIADVARLTAVGGGDPTTGDDACVDTFIAGFGRRAWRRPLDPDELQSMRQVYTDTADPEPSDGVAGVVAAMLQSPQFMYRPEPVAAGGAIATPLEPFALA